MTRPNTNRTILACAALLTTGALTLTACGNNDANPSNNATKENSTTQNPTTQNTADTRTVTDVDGEKITVPAHPQRVVALSEPAVDALIALDSKPIGAVAARGVKGVANHLGDKGKDIEILGTLKAPSIEKIGAAKPDLIVVDGTAMKKNSPELAQLKNIAPVVYTGNTGGNWKENFQRIADAVNKKDEGEKIIADYEKRAGELKAKLKKKYADQTFSVVRWQGNNASLILGELPSVTALTDVGLKRPADQAKEGKGHSSPVSAENLSKIDADHIFFGTLGGSSVNNPKAGGEAGEDASREALTEAEKTLGFDKLKAYREHHIYPVDGSAWTTTGGPLLMNKILDDIEHILL